MSYALNEFASYSCSGDISLGSGSIFSDSKIVISADGAINLEGITLTAPVIDLMSQQGNISFGDNVSIVTDSFSVSASNGGSLAISSSPGSTLTIGLDGVSRVTPLEDISLTSGTGGSINLGSRDISLVTTVPLPASSLLFLSGIVALFSRMTISKSGYA